MSDAFGNCAHREPDFISAGTSVHFKRCFGTYAPVNGWYIQYSIIGEGIQITFQSTPSTQGNEFIMTVPASTTAAWIPNDNAVLTGYAILPANYANNGLPELVREIYHMQCPIKPNLIAPAANQPSLTWTEQAIIAVRTLFLNKTNDDLLIAHVGDSSFRFESQEQVYETLCKLEARHQRELDRQRAANGKPSRNRIIPVVRITPSGQLWGTTWPFAGPLGN